MDATPTSNAPALRDFTAHSFALSFQSWMPFVCSFLPVVDVFIRSEGCNDPGKTPETCGVAYIQVDGNEHSPKKRGYDVVVVDGQTGRNLLSRVVLIRYLCIDLHEGRSIGVHERYRRTTISQARVVNVLHASATLWSCGILRVRQ